MIDDACKIDVTGALNSFPVCLSDLRRQAAARQRAADRLAFCIHAQQRKFLKILEAEVMPAVPLGNRLHEFFKLLALRRENLEALCVAFDEMAERPEDVIEAKQMNGAYVVVGVIAGLNMQAQSRFNLVNGCVGVSDAGDCAGGAAHIFDCPDQLGNYHTRLAAAGAGSQHEIVVAADGASLIGR